MLGPAMMFRAKPFCATPPALSVTWTVKLAGPAAVGLPLITPPALNERPAGGDPLATAQVNPVLVPPDAASVCE